MMRYLLALLLISVCSFSAEYVEGEGQFESKQEDPLTLVNDQLKYNAFVDVITKELDAMGLNSRLFWQKHQESFEGVFTNVDEELKKKYAIGEEPSRIQKQDYENNRRIRRYQLLQKFGNLQNVVQSYSIKRTSRSSHNPRMRFIKLEARIDRNLLAKIYYQFVRGKQSSSYGTLFIDAEYELDGIDFSELGVDNEKDFVETVNEYWVKWFADNKPRNIQSVGILNEQEAKSLNEYFKRPYEEMLSNIPDRFRNSLYLKIKLNIRKPKGESRAQEQLIEYSGGMVLQDLQSAQYLVSYDFDTVNKAYKVSKDTELGNIVANYVYRMPMKSFPQLNKVIHNIPPMSQIQRVGLYDYKNLGQVYGLMDLITGQGVKYSVKTQLDSIGNNRAEMIVFYNGEPQDFKSMLRKLESANSSLSFDFIESDNVLGIKFNKEKEKTQNL